MSSFAARKVRVFKECGDNEIVKKRSDGRMKAYPSATDARAWVTEREERRQHILDLVRGDSGKGMALGKYVPIEVLIDTLLANKNADIENLQEQIEELQQLLACYEKLDLTPEQRQQLERLKGQIGKADGYMKRGRPSDRSGVDDRVGRDRDKMGTGFSPTQGGRGSAKGPGYGGPSSARDDRDTRGEKFDDPSNKPDGAAGGVGMSQSDNAGLQQGLAFEELQYMHSKVCDATAKVLQHGSDVPLERKSLKKRSNKSQPMNISDRQKQAQDLISRLQDEINVEKKKLGELKDNLEKEKVTNIGLISQIKAQSRAVNVMKAEREQVIQTKEEICKYSESIRNDNIRLRELEADLVVERQNNKHLKHMLQAPAIPNNTANAVIEEIHNNNQDAMRFELNKALTSDMILKMQMHQSLARTPKGIPEQSPCMSVRRPVDCVAKGKVLTTTFYTELKVENICDQKKIHMSRIERSSKSSKPSCHCEPDEKK